MKRINKYIGFAMLAVAAMGSGACQQSEIECFDPNYAALNMWVGTEGIPSENVVFNYSYSISEQPVKFYARITGTPSDRDRTFTLVAEGEGAEAAKGSYRVETYTIPAGKISGEFAVYFDPSKLANPDAFADAEGEIVFRMVENGDFRQGAEGLTTLKVKLRNYLSKPAEWDKGANGLYTPLKTYFGDYSKVKHRFMIEVTGLVDFRIYYNASKPYDEKEGIISRGYATYLKQTLQTALEQYNASHETALTDEYGNPVIF